MTSELITNTATPGQASPICSLLEPIQTTPAPGTVETYAVSAPAPFDLRDADGQFRVVVDDEIMVVTAKADGSSPWQFKRGAENSPPQTHRAGSSVFYSLTKGGITALIAQGASNLGLGSAAFATLNAASGAAKVGSDGFLGGTAGTPLSPSVVLNGSVGLDVVKDFGADSSGATDPTDAFVAAHAEFLTYPAGVRKRLIVPDGTYLLNGGASGPSSGGGISWAVALYADNLEIVGGRNTVYKTTVNCATFLVAGASKPAGPANWAAHYMSDVTATPVKAFTGPLAQGATQAPISPSDAVALDLAAGDYVFLRTGQTAGIAGSGFVNNPDSEINQVKSVNTGTGVITLRWPLSKPMAQEYFTTSSRDGATTTSVTSWPAPFGIAKVTDRLLRGCGFIGGKFKHTGDAATANGNGAPIYTRPVQGFGLLDFHCELGPGTESSSTVCALNENRGTRIDYKRVHFTAEAPSLTNHDILNADTGCTDYKAAPCTASAETGVVTMELHEGCSLVEIGPHVLINPPSDPSTVPTISCGGRNYRCTIHEPTIVNGPTSSQTILVVGTGAGNGNRLIKPTLIGTFPSAGATIFTDDAGWQVSDWVAPAGATISLAGTVYPVTVEYESGFRAFKRIHRARRTLLAHATGSVYLASDGSDDSTIFYFEPARYAGGAHTPKLKLTALFCVGAVAPGASVVFTVEMVPVTATGGTASVVPTTTGAILGGASVLTGPAANSISVPVTNEIALPVAGAYCLIVAISGANMAANSAVSVEATLDVHQV